MSEVNVFNTVINIESTQDSTPSIQCKQDQVYQTIESVRTEPYINVLEYKCSDSGGGGSVAVADVAREIEVEVVCGEDMSALRLFYIGSDGKAYLANASSTYEQSQAVGMSKNAALQNGTIKGLLFGKISDPFFNFPLNEDLFLGSNGTLTDQDPQSLGFLFQKKVGISLGAGAIFLNINSTIIL